MLLFQVTTTPNCIVGDWILEVDTKVKKEREEQAKSLRYTAKQPVYILFNPWCKRKYTLQYQKYF